MTPLPVVGSSSDRNGCTAVVSRAGSVYAAKTYAAKTRRPSARAVSDAATTTLIECVHEDNYGV
jgi:hypothetical protein